MAQSAVTVAAKAAAKVYRRDVNLGKDSDGFINAMVLAAFETGYKRGYEAAKKEA